LSILHGCVVTSYPSRYADGFKSPREFCSNLLALIIHEDSWRNRWDALWDGQAQLGRREAYLNSMLTDWVASTPVGKAYRRLQ